MKNVICSKDPKDYLRRLNTRRETKMYLDDYLDEKTAESLISISRSKVAKQFIKDKRIVEMNQRNEVIDLERNIFKFDCKYISIIIDNGDIWFKGKDVSKVLGYVNSKDALKKTHRQY